MHSTALVSSHTLRLTLAAGCLALIALSGCAPVDATSDGPEVPSIDALTPTAAPGQRGVATGVAVVHRGHARRGRPLPLGAAR